MRTSARKKRSTDGDVDDVVVPLALSRNKEISLLTDQDFAADRFGAELLRKVGKEFARRGGNDTSNG